MSEHSMYKKEEREAVHARVRACASIGNELTYKRRLNVIEDRVQVPLDQVRDIVTTEEPPVRTVSYVSHY